MRRLADSMTAFLAGLLVGVALCAAIAPDAWAPTPRPSPQADSGRGPEKTTERVSPLPSPDSAARTGPPDRGTPAPTPTPRVTARPAPAKPRAVTTRHSLRGYAVWYDYRWGHAAAGPELRRALGPSWRGRTVTVCAARCIRVVLSDWCACRSGNRLIDLDVRSFAALADPSRGVIPVTVRW